MLVRPFDSLVSRLNFSSKVLRSRSCWTGSEPAEARAIATPRAGKSRSDARPMRERRGACREGGYDRMDPRDISGADPAAAGKIASLVGVPLAGLETSSR